jgi:hypothetical protein
MKINQAGPQLVFTFDNLFSSTGWAVSQSVRYIFFRLQPSYLSAASHTGRKSCRAKSLYMKRFWTCPHSPPLPTHAWFGICPFLHMWVWGDANGGCGDEGAEDFLIGPLSHMQVSIWPHNWLMSMKGALLIPCLQLLLLLGEPPFPALYIGAKHAHMKL